MHLLGGECTRENGVRRGTNDRQHTRDSSLEVYSAIGQKGIGQAERKFFQSGLSLYHSLSVLLTVSSCQHGYLTFVLCKQGIHMVASVGIGEVDGIYSHVSHWSSFIGEFVHANVSRDGGGLIGLHIVNISMQQPSQMGSIGHHAGQFGHVDIVHAQGDILQGFLVRRGIDFQSCTVVSQQVHQSQYLSLAG